MNEINNKYMKNTNKIIGKAFLLLSKVKNIY